MNKVWTRLEVGLLIRVALRGARRFKYYEFLRRAHHIFHATRQIVA